ncbi:MAG: rod shape-determining protein MreD [Bacilli bacterium]|nr:rod shape-determining protein MreD [Bacilli bacterium]
MILIVITIIISFLLEGLVSHFFPFMLNNIGAFYPMFTLISLVLIYPYFNKDNTKFSRVGILAGLFYDMVYTNMFPFNIVSFFIMTLLIRLLNLYLSNNYINALIMCLTVLIGYEFSNFIVLNIIGYTTISFNSFFYKLYNSILINLLYVIIGYYLLTRISKKYNIRRID